MNATTIAASAALGLEVQFSRPVGLRLELSDQIAADPLSDQDFTFSSVIAGTALPANTVHTARLVAAVTVRFSS